MSKRSSNAGAAAIASAILRGLAVAVVWRWRVAFYQRSKQSRPCAVEATKSHPSSLCCDSLSIAQSMVDLVVRDVLRRVHIRVTFLGFPYL